MPPKKSKKLNVPEPNLNQLRKKQRDNEKTQNKLNSFQMFRQFKLNQQSGSQSTAQESYLKRRKMQIAQRILKLRDERRKIQSQQFASTIKLLRSVRIEPERREDVAPDYVRYYLSLQSAEGSQYYVEREQNDELTSIILLKKCNFIQTINKNSNELKGEHQSSDKNECQVSDKDERIKHNAVSIVDTSLEQNFTLQ